MKDVIRFTAAVALCVAGFAAVATVSAHVNYVSSSPSAGEHLTSSPATVKIVFDAEIQATDGSFGIDVTGASGASVVSGSASRGTDKMSTSIALKPDLPDGAYHVAWHQTSADDGDPEEGEFSFTVGAAGAAPLPASPAPEAMPHTHDDADDHADVPGAPPTTGLIVLAMDAQSGSGVDGRAEIIPVDGGAKTQIAVYLNGVAENSVHPAHVHVSSTCTEGPQLVHLKDVVAAGTPHGRSVTVADVPFSTFANGKNVILAHPSATSGAIIACGKIPAQPAAAALPKGLPQTGNGGASHGANALALFGALALVGTMAVTGGVAYRRRNG